MTDFSALTRDLTANLGKSFRTPTKGGVGHDDDDIDDGSIPSVVFGTELALIRDSGKLCLGRVGNGEKVCLKENAGCTVRSHRTSRMSLEHSVCFLVRSGDTATAFATPCLDALPLGNSYREQLLLRTGVDWAKKFTFIAENKILVASQETEMEGLTQDVLEQKMPQTPARTKSMLTIRDGASQVFIQNIALKDDFEKRALPTVSLKALREASAEDVQALSEHHDELIAYRVEKTGEAALHIGEFLQRLAKEHEGNLAALEQSIAGLRGLLSLLKGSVGEPSIQLPISNLTLWSTVQGVLERLDSAEEVIKAVGLALRDLQDSQAARAVRHRQRDASIRGGILRRSITKSENDSAWGGGFRAFGSSYPQEDMGDGYRDTSNNGSRNERSERNGGDSGEGQGSGHSGGGGGGGRRPNQVNFDLDDFGSRPLGEEDDEGEFETGNTPEEHTQLGDLEQRLRRLELMQAGRTTDQVVFFGNHSFNSRADLNAFLDGFIGGLSIPSGLFPSPHQLLNLIYLELAGTLPGMKDFKALRDLGVSNRDFSATMAAFKVLPAPFEANSRLKTHCYQSSVGTPARFKAIPSYTDWGLRSYEDSLCFKFNRELDRVEGKLQSSISIEFGGHPPLQVIASGMLRSSTRFVRGLFDYMTECYDSLNASFNSPSETWDLVCFSVEQLFMNEFTAARVGMVEEDFTDPRKLALDVIWSNLKCMSVVDGFNQCGIAKHPSMNGAQIRFVLKMSQTNNVGTLERKVASQEREIKELKELVSAQATSLSSLEGKIRSVESRADKACEAAGVPSSGRRGQGNRGGGGGGGSGGGSA